jgi:hypothetical protein
MLKTRHIQRVILKSAQDSPRLPGNSPGLEITPGVLEYCLNQIFVEIIMEYDAKWSYLNFIIIE